MHNFLIARLTASLSHHSQTLTQSQWGFHRHNSFLFFNAFTSVSLAESNHHQGQSFTVSYLINSCGLSPAKAVKASERVQLQNPDNPNVVLNLLKSYGFSQTHVAKLVEHRPLMLLANAEKTLLPKLKFLHSVGVSSTDLPRIVVTNCHILFRSLDNCLIPRYKILRSILRDDEEVIKSLKRWSRIFTTASFIDNLVTNIEVLRRHGVPQGSISFLLTNFPEVVYKKNSEFVEAVKTTKEMGFDPLKINFVAAVQVLAKMNKEMWESRLGVYERWGWSRRISLLAFGKYPQCMMISENKIMKSMSFLVKDMGWPSDDIAHIPAILSASLQKRLIPRCIVVKILKSKGLIRKDLRLGAFMLLSEKHFLEKFVSKFQENVPLLLDAYKGWIDHLDVL